MPSKHIFFDLDHTIWDFDKNAEETLHELYGRYDLRQLGIHSPDTFIEIYTRNNHELWAQYHLGRISKEELRTTRFARTFIEMGVAPERVPERFETDYVTICPTKTNLFPYAHEVLEYLQGKYTLHIISNGFKESTEYKIRNTGIEKYFSRVIISEIVGMNKPDRAIFEHAVNLAETNFCDSLMIGDSIEADIRGAIGCGMQAIYFNPARLETPEDVAVEISCLSELKTML